MVCKKSLYCLKNGPCASEQLRKQIWEDNIKFRENFRALNQSDHYWSFQIANGKCGCNGDDFKSPYIRRNGSLQRLANECTSVAHDNKYNTSALCPNFAQLNLDRNRSVDNVYNRDLYRDQGVQYGYNEVSHSDVPENISLTPIDIRKSILRNPNDQSARRSNRFTASFNNTYRRGSKIRIPEIETPVCSRYRNELQRLKTDYKVRFSSQPNLKKICSEPKKFVMSNENLRIHKKDLDNISKKENIVFNNLKKHDCLEKENRTLKNEVDDDLRNVRSIVFTKKKVENEPVKDVNQNMESKNLVSPKNIPILKPNMLPPDSFKKVKRLGMLKLPYTPVTRTTRNWLQQEKVAPFVPFGSYNQDSDVGNKRTHNVLAAEKETFPNATLAHRQRRNSIIALLESEKQFQQSLLPNNVKKPQKTVNHSSVWMQDSNKKLSNTKHRLRSDDPKKYIRYFPPISKNHLKEAPIMNSSCKLVNVSPSLARKRSKSYLSKY